jgi:hypothetical protein
VSCGSDSPTAAVSGSTDPLELRGMGRAIRDLSQRVWEARVLLASR